MWNVSYRRWTIGLGAVVMSLAVAAGAAAQAAQTDATHHARRLGGSTSFYAPPLRTVADLAKMAARPNIAADIRTVLGQAGIPEAGDAVLATLTGATSSVKFGPCDKATPADGTIVECEFQPGSTLRWMAYRPDARKGNRTPGRVEIVQWDGDRPFKAFLFRVTNDHRIYTFVVPLACANLSLMSIEDAEATPIDVSVDRVCDPATGALRATVKADGKDLGRVSRVRATINGQPAGELTAPSWTLVTAKPGDYAFDAIDTRGRSFPVARQTLPVLACPPPLAAAPARVVAPTCVVALSAERVKGAYEIHVDATGSSTGASGVAPAVTVQLSDDTGASVGQTLTLDQGRKGTIGVRKPGLYRATATVTTPQGVVVGADRYEGSATCESSVTAVKPASSVSMFFDALAGKERRVRPIEDTDLEFGQCSPLAGVKLGVAKRFQNDWELAGAVGAAISLVTDDDKVRESALFIDAEINKYLANGVFFGTGLGLWDVTRSDTWTPAWLLHVGLPVWKSAKYPVHLIGEGRLFLDNVDDIASNYLFWAGVRVHLNRP
jgi:hypothetical protein